MTYNQKILLGGLLSVFLIVLLIAPLGCEEVQPVEDIEEAVEDIEEEQEEFLRFLGSSGWVEIEDPVQVQPGVEGLTVTYWMKLHEFGEDKYQYGFHLAQDKGYSQVTNSIIYSGLNRDNIFAFNIGATTGHYSDGWTDIVPALGQWYHVAGTWDGELVSIYLSGELVHSYPLASIDGSDASIFIGGHSRQEGWRVIDAFISEVSYWHKGLTEEEILDIMNQGLVGDEEGLVGYWPLNEGVGYTAFDQSENERHGIIKGASWEKDLE